MSGGRNARVDRNGQLISATQITALRPGEVFVFGSNGGGRHRGGAARFALDHFGAVWGEGHGLHGTSYAIDTMSGKGMMMSEIATFLAFARTRPETTFLVTELGCGIAGYRPADVAPAFRGAPGNVALPASFATVLERVDMLENPKEHALTLTSHQLDRAIGAVLASAAGDALGSQYEFGPARPDAFTPEFGVGVFGHDAGEWTDDTAMAMPILHALADGDSLRDAAVLEGIVASWVEWSRTAKDVGAQTRGVLAALHGDHSERNARNVSQQLHQRSGRSGGNGSLMRTGPVALGFLGPRGESALADAARRIAQLTHWEDDNIDATTLWCLGIRHAILTGELNVRAGLAHVPTDRRQRWAELIDEALTPDAHPRDFQANNGWVVRAFQGALAAVAGARDVRDALERAVRGGGDTDTVAAIAGALAGARWGGTQVPLSWQRRLHGWPGISADILVRQAALAARNGRPDRVGWPSAPRVRSEHFLHTAPVRHPHDAGVWLGSQNALGELPSSVGAVVSLCRVGTAEIPAGVEGIRVWLIDQDGENLNLDHTLTDAADLIAELRAEGIEVFVHCAEARSRTSAVAAAYAVRHRGIPLDRAWVDLKATLPYYAPARYFRDALARI